MLGTNPALWNAWGDYDRKRFTVEDFAVGMIKFDNGAVVSLESSFMSNGPEVFDTQLYGTKAGALVTPYAPGNDGIKVYTEQDRLLLDVTPANIAHVESAHVDEIRAFVEAIRDGKPSPVPGENGLILNAIFDAIYASSESGEEQTVDVTF
jgi:predicted dehydrogenase